MLRRSARKWYGRSKSWRHRNSGAYGEERPFAGEPVNRTGLPIGVARGRASRGQFADRPHLPIWVTVLRVVEDLWTGVPSASQRSGANGGFADELLGGFFGRERRRVEPPADVAEIVFHVGFELLVAIELELLVGVSRLAFRCLHTSTPGARITRRTGRGDMRASRRSSIARSCTTVSIEHGEPEVDKVVGERAHVALAQLVLPERLVSRRAHEPHAAAQDHLVHVVTLDLSRPRQQASSERGRRSTSPRPAFPTR